MGLCNLACVLAVGCTPTVPKEQFDADTARQRKTYAERVARAQGENDELAAIHVAERKTLTAQQDRLQATAAALGLALAHKQMLDAVAVVETSSLSRALSDAGFEVEAVGQKLVGAVPDLGLSNRRTPVWAKGLAAILGRFVTTRLRVTARAPTWASARARGLRVTRALFDLGADRSRVSVAFQLGADRVQVELTPIFDSPSPKNDSVKGH